MIIPPKAVDLTHSQSPILNLSEREIKNPEGVGFDLRLSAVHVLYGQGALLVNTRKTPKANLLDHDSDGVYTLKPKIWYLVTTIETVNLPINMAAMVFPRSTLFRSGVELHTSVTPPGYEGPLTFGLSVSSDEGFKIQKGARFCHLVLMEVAEGSTKYRGQWNYGRIDSPNEERQV